MKDEVLPPVTESNADCCKDFSSYFMETINKTVKGLTDPSCNKTTLKWSSMGWNAQSYAMNLDNIQDLIFRPILAYIATVSQWGNEISSWLKLSIGVKKKQPNPATFKL